ncbi:MAG: DUF2293 domain-containing protein [Elusimicrobia bacterium]|nr:DUF2293 domain-containing protein [Elusimicrobiota bacterium]
MGTIPRAASARPRSLEHRIVEAADAALAARKIVTPIDALMRIGWLPQSGVDRWRQGRADFLEQEISADPTKLSSALRLLHSWAERRGLRPSETAYVSATRERRPLRFSKTGDPGTERAYRTHWLSRDLRGKEAERVRERSARPPDLVVISPIREWECSSCGSGDGFMRMEDGAPLCLGCADMDHLVFLPAGDAALSRRAKAASGLWAVVVRFSRSRKRYERQGLLVEEAALEHAEAECLADTAVRARRREREEARRATHDTEFQAALARETTRLFPSCPPQRAEAIARHTGTRASGRVGRTAAGRALDPEAVTLAVIASVRHQDTPYDELLMSGATRADARERVRAVVDAVLKSWSASPQQ